MSKIGWQSKMGFGKYKDETILTAWIKDKDYFRYCINEKIDQRKKNDNIRLIFKMSGPIKVVFVIGLIFLIIIIIKEIRARKILDRPEEFNWLQWIWFSAYTYPKIKRGAKECNHLTEKIIFKIDKANIKDGKK